MPRIKPLLRVALCLPLVAPVLGAPTVPTDLPKIIYVRPVPMNDDAFLRQGTRGVNHAAARLGMTAQTLESQPNRASRLQQLQAAVAQGAKYVVLLGYEFKELMATFPRQAPQTQFVIVHHCVDNPAPNLSCITFRAGEASYLAGIEAALSTRSGKVGVIGAVETPFSRDEVAAFVAGARATRPEVQVLAPVWIGGDQPFNDPPRAARLATELLAQGADRVLAVAAGSNRGVFKALEGRPDALALGSDINQCEQAPGKVLDNVEVSVDVAIELTLAAAQRGPLPAHVSYGLREGAVGLTSLGLDSPLSGCLAATQSPLLARLRATKAAIVGGTLSVAGSR